MCSKLTMWVEYPAALNRSARVTSSSGRPHGEALSISWYCIPVRNVSRPDINDDCVVHATTKPVNNRRGGGRGGGNIKTGLGLEGGGRRER